MTLRSPFGMNDCCLFRSFETRHENDCLVAMFKIMSCFNFKALCVGAGSRSAMKCSTGGAIGSIRGSKPRSAKVGLVLFT